jgi:hypothetical protein
MRSKVWAAGNAWSQLLAAINNSNGHPPDLALPEAEMDRKQPANTY